MNSKVHSLNNEAYSQLYPIIDQEKCCGDELCVKECIRRCLSMNDDGKAQYKAVAMPCFQCGHCIAVCPKNAISFEHVDTNALAHGKIDVDSEKLSHLMQMRRSIRDFKEEQIPQEEIEKVLETISYAPTGSNTQQLSWVLLSSQEKINTLAGLATDALAENSNSNPAMQKTAIQLQKAFKKGRNRITYNAPHVVITYAPKEFRMTPVDSTIALSYLELLLNSKNIGTCWIGYIMLAANSDNRVNEFLGIPDGYTVTGAMAFGYSKHKYQRSVMRKNVNLKVI